MRTYQKEYTIVGLFLSIPVMLNPTTVNALAALAIFFTFQSHQVAGHLQEKQDTKNPSVECHKKLNLYYYIKEGLWMAFFIWSGAYSGIIGSGVFLAYPYWRSYRKNSKLRNNKLFNEQQSINIEHNKWLAKLYNLDYDEVSSVLEKHPDGFIKELKKLEKLKNQTNDPTNPPITGA